MNKSLAALSIFSFLLIFASISAAQLGEVAGQPHFNVSIGGTQTIKVIVVNQASYPLPVKTILPTLASKDANAITPTITASPLVGNIPADGELDINVTVYMPGGTNKPGYNWTGVMQVVTAPTGGSAPSGGGASIFEGVAKIITVTATAHVFSIWDYLWLIVLIVAIVVVVIVVFFARSRGMLGGKSVSRARSKVAAKKGGRAKAKPRRKSTKRRRKGAARRRARPTRRRRRR